MAEELTDLEKEKEHWMNSKWRPAMGWMYMAVCITDFILYPVLWAIFQAWDHITPVKPWEPLTLQGAGLFHIAMGAVLGVSAWSRGQEKIAGVNNGGLNTFSTAPTTSTGPTTYTAPTPYAGPQTGGTGYSFNTAPAGGYIGNTGFGATTDQPEIARTASGKKIVPLPPDPVI